MMEASEYMKSGRASGYSPASTDSAEGFDTFNARGRSGCRHFPGSRHSRRSRWHKGCPGYPGPAHCHLHSIPDWKRPESVLIFVKDLFHEVIEGTGIGAGDVAQNRFGWPGSIDISPSFGCGEDGGQLFDGDIGQEIIFLADGDGQGIGTDAELDGGTADSGTRFNFAVFDRTAGIGDSDSPATQKRSKPAPEPMLSMVMLPA